MEPAESSFLEFIENNPHLDEILNSVSDLVAFYKSPDLKIAWANKVAADSVGLEISTIIGRYCYKIWSRTQEPCPECPVVRVFQTKKPESLLRKTFDGRFFHLRAFPIFSKTGEFEGAVELGSEITREKRLEAALRSNIRLDAMKWVIGGLAHDFNNLLAVMTGYSDLLLDSELTITDAQEYAQEIGLAVRKAKNIISKLLTFKNEEGLNFRPIDLRVFIDTHKDGFLTLVQRDIDNELRVDVVEEPVQIYASEEILEEIFKNLLLNAMEAMKTKGIIKISAKIEKDVQFFPLRDDKRVFQNKYLVLTVSDNGYGIDPELMPFIYEPFKSTKPIRQNVGLGLSVVYGLVNQLNGLIHIESEKNKGTMVKISLPIYNTGVSETGGRDGQKITSSPHEILVVEDDEKVLQLLETILTRAKYRVTLSSNGEEGLKIFQAAFEAGNPYDLVITDITMPKMSGDLLVEQILELAPNLPIIFLSAYGKFEINEDLLKRPNISLIQKPFSRRDLLNALKDITSE